MAFFWINLVGLKSQSNSQHLSSRKSLKKAKTRKPLRTRREPKLKIVAKTCSDHEFRSSRLSLDRKTHKKTLIEYPLHRSIESDQLETITRDPKCHLSHFDIPSYKPRVPLTKTTLWKPDRDNTNRKVTQSHTLRTFKNFRHRLQEGSARLQKSQDVESNPGPRDAATGQSTANFGQRTSGQTRYRPPQAALQVVTYNVRGITEETKLRHLINHFYKGFLSQNSDFISAL